jgi:hypothetical protein
MEENDRLAKANVAVLPALCRSLIDTGAQLFAGVQPISTATIHELQLLTIGPQLRGAENNVIGQDATRIVFELVRSLVAAHITTSTEQVITIKNAAGRIVRIAFASDPDIAIMETLPTMAIPSVSIEIKGGKDVSNVHNRIGEAEKSHQKAKSAGFTQFWTILNARIAPDMAGRESPTTTAFFNLDDVLAESTAAHHQFRDLLYQTIGVA